MPNIFLQLGWCNTQRCTTPHLSSTTPHPGSAAAIRATLSIGHQGHHDQPEEANSSDAMQVCTCIREVHRLHASTCDCTTLHPSSAGCSPQQPGSLVTRNGWPNRMDPRPSLANECLTHIITIAHACTSLSVSQSYSDFTPIKTFHPLLYRSLLDVLSGTDRHEKPPSGQQLLWSGLRRIPN